MFERPSITTFDSGNESLDWQLEVLSTLEVEQKSLNFLSDIESSCEITFLLSI